MTMPEPADPILDALTMSGLIDGVSEPLLLRGDVRRLAERDFLCRRNDPATCLWIVLSGAVAAKIDTDTIVVRSRGYVVGEQALLVPGGRRTADLVAHGGPVQVLTVSMTAIEDHPNAARIWRNCATVLSNKLTEATNQRIAMNRELDEKHQLLARYVGTRALSEQQLAPKTFFENPQRYRAIIWFSDVSGFSKYAADMPPERSSDFVQRFLAPQVDAVENRGGYIDKFVGDLVMAYWIVTSATGERECAAALEAAQESLAAVHAIELGTDRLATRTGLHIGEVSAGNFGTQTRSQYTLIGPNVNLAARLEQVRDDDVVDGGKLGWIRVSEKFFGSLPEGKRGDLPVKASVRAKNIGVVGVHASAAAEEQ